MNNKYKLNKLGSVNRGKSKHRPRNDPALYGGKYPFIQTGDVKHSLFYVTSHTQTYNEKGLEQSKLWPEGTLCITIAANIAETAILSYPACFPDSIIGFIPDPKKADVKFIKYCLETYKLQMQAISQGTTQDNMSLEKLLSLDFYVPELVQQKKIAAILSAYDDLIENNKRRIALLEKMAEEIYREWFVRFRFPGYKNAEFDKGIPRGWVVRSLSDIAKINSSTLKKGAEFDFLDYVDIRSVTTNYIEETTRYNINEAPSRARRKVKHGDIIWSSVRPANRAYSLIFRPKENLIVSTGFAVISPKTIEFYPFIYQAVTTNSYVDQITVVAKGSAYPATSFNDFEKSSILVPNDNLIKNYHLLCNSLYEQKYILDKQNKQLNKIKYLLLPRLISGKLSVENLDIQFPPSMLND